MDLNIPVQNPGLRDIYPLFCGREQCEKKHSYGPAVRDYFLIHHILSGKGTFVYGKTYSLHEGQCFLICPGDVTYYKADETEPWSYLWIAFSGELADTLLSHAGLGSKNPVFGSSGISLMFRRLDALLQSETRLESGRLGLSLLSMIFSLLSYLPQQENFETQKEKYVRQAKDYIASMIPRKISVERLAVYCGLDRRYLCRIFRQQTGRTLQQYIIGMKMHKAMSLLQTSSLSVGDISRSVGYSDVYNFSKMFKKQFGLSPANQRKAKTPRPFSGMCGADKNPEE